MQYGQPYHQPPIPGVPKVRILDENGKQVLQCGYYIHSEKVNYCGAFGDDLTDEQLAENTLHLVAITDQGDWNMKNTVRLIRVTPPHRIEVIEDTCENEAHNAMTFVCSKCGCDVSGGDELGHNSSHGGFRFCPSCGRRVGR